MKNNITGYSERTKTKYSVEIERQVDEDGVAHITETRKAVHYGEGRFLRIDIENYYTMMECASRAAYDLLRCLTHVVNRNDNIVYRTYEKMSAEFNIPESSLLRAMRELQDRDIVRNVSHGLFMLNPIVAFGTHESLREKYTNIYYALKTGGRKEKKENDNRQHDETSSE